MTLEELFSKLSRGELSNLAMSSEGSGEIVENKTEQLINYTNEGLLKLYSRFILKESELMIEQQAHITQYHMLPKYTQSNGSSKVIRYILDLHCAPFTGDLIKILRVFDLTGCERPMNDEESYNSVYTPQPHVLQVPYPIQGEPLSVSYQAKHKILSVADMDDVIDIPSTLEIPLQNYVAYKVFCHMNGQENIAKGQEFLSSYEADCMEIENKDLLNGTKANTPTRFNRRGWV